MRAQGLLVSLKAFLDSTLAGFPLPDPALNGVESVGGAQCFFGNVPDDGTQDLPERFPFVVIRWMEGTSDEEGENIEQVALILGVYSPSGPGEAELITACLMDHLRAELMRSRILAETFDLQMPLEAAKPDPERRQHNYHIATIMTRWSHRTPRRPLDPDAAFPDPN